MYKPTAHRQTVLKSMIKVIREYEASVGEDIDPRARHQLYEMFGRACQNDKLAFPHNALYCRALILRKSADQVKEVIRLCVEAGILRIFRQYKVGANCRWYQFVNTNIRGYSLVWRQRSDSESDNQHYNGTCVSVDPVYALPDGFPPSLRRFWHRVCVSTVVYRSVSAADDLRWHKEHVRAHDDLELELPFDDGTCSPTAYGEITRNFYRDANLPSVDCRVLFELAESSQQFEAWCDSLASCSDGVGCPGGVSIRRKDGRIYSPLSSLPKVIRRDVWVLRDGIRVKFVEVDVHAMYWCALVSMLKDGVEKDRVVEMLQNGTFYSTIEELCGADKKEVNIRGLFNRNLKRNRVSVAIGSFAPSLAKLVWLFRKSLGLTLLSKLLTRLEGRCMYPALKEFALVSGEPCLPLHDAMLVPETHAELAADIVMKHASHALGFRPRVAYKNAAHVAAA